MNLALVLDRWDPGKGGAERALAKLAEAWIDAGHEATVFAMRATGLGRATFHRVAGPPLPRGPRDAAFAKRAVAAARAAGCDAVLGVRHVTGIDVYWPHGGVHAETLAAVERSKGRAAGVSRALHRLSAKQRTLVALERRFYAEPGPARIWCVSRLVEREILARWPACAARIEVHRNGVDLATFAPRLREDRRARVLAELGVAGDAPVLLFLGGAWRLKGWPVLLDALASLVRERWTLVAAGDRHAAAARAAARAGLARRVVVVPRRDPRDLYAIADVLVQPTWRDPCSLATLEALASGVPVVTTEANGAADALTGHPDAGTIVPAGDPAALAAAISTWRRRPRDPDVVRRAVADRDERVWLAGLVRSLEVR